MPGPEEWPSSRLLNEDARNPGIFAEQAGDRIRLTGPAATLSASCNRSARRRTEARRHLRLRPAHPVKVRSPVFRRAERLALSRIEKAAQAWAAVKLATSLTWSVCDGARPPSWSSRCRAEAGPPVRERTLGCPARRSRRHLARTPVHLRRSRWRSQRSSWTLH